MSGNESESGAGLGAVRAFPLDVVVALRLGTSASGGQVL
jgi:hypothetical protein